MPPAALARCQPPPKGCGRHFEGRFTYSAFRAYLFTLPLMILAGRREMAILSSRHASSLCYSELLWLRLTAGSACRGDISLRHFKDDLQAIFSAMLERRYRRWASRLSVSASSLCASIIASSRIPGLLIASRWERGSISSPRFSASASEGKYWRRALRLRG